MTATLVQTMVLASSRTGANQSDMASYTTWFNWPSFGTLFDIDFTSFIYIYIYIDRERDRQTDRQTDRHRQTEDCTNAQLNDADREDRRPTPA